MGALKLPRVLAVTRLNKHLCARIGVRLDGEDLGTKCLAYDADKGVVHLTGGVSKSGTVEPYWR